MIWREKNIKVITQLWNAGSKHHANFSTYFGPEVSRREKTGERVPDEYQLVRSYNEALSSGDEDSRRLVSLHAAEEHIHGVRQAGEVGEALRGVEGEQLRVLQGEGHWQRRGGGQLEQEKEDENENQHKKCRKVARRFLIWIKENKNKTFRYRNSKLKKSWEIKIKNTTHIFTALCKSHYFLGYCMENGSSDLLKHVETYIKI